jgi:hypothetical protein
MPLRPSGDIMTRQHPVHDTIAALTRVHHQHIHITPTTSYRVHAPCLLQQLADELGVSDRGAGGHTTPTAGRVLVATDAFDLWQQIHTLTHSWATELQLDQRPYHRRVSGGRGADRPTQQRQPPPWYATLTLPDDTPAEVLTRIGTRLDQITTAPPPPPVARQPRPDPTRARQLPPVGRLLRLVAGTATGRGLDQTADIIWRHTTRWHTQIQQMLTGRAEQQGIRGASCPQPSCAALCSRHRHPPNLCPDPACCTAAGCQPAAVLDIRHDGGYLVPAIVLVRREVAGEPLSWLTCLACGWSRNLAALEVTA